MSGWSGPVGASYRWPPDAEVVGPALVEHVGELLAVFHAAARLAAGVFLFGQCEALPVELPGTQARPRRIGLPPPVALEMGVVRAEDQLRGGAANRGRRLVPNDDRALGRPVVWVLLRRRRRLEQRSTQLAVLRYRRDETAHDVVCALRIDRVERRKRIRQFGQSLSLLHRGRLRVELCQRRLNGPVVQASAHHSLFAVGFDGTRHGWREVLVAENVVRRRRRRSPQLPAG